LPTKFESDIEKIARAFLTHVSGQDGAWVRGIDAFNAAIATEQCRKLGWVRYIEGKPKARIAVTRVIERLMQDEFHDIEKEKRGSYQFAPVFFRLRKSPRHP